MGKKRTESTVSRLTKRDDTKVILRLLAEAQKVAHAGSWSFDLNTKELRCSDELYRIFGLNPGRSRPTYQTFLKRVHPEDLDYVTETLANAVQHIQSFCFDHKIVLPGGTERIIHQQSEVIEEPPGHPARMIGVTQDITEHRAAQDELQKK